MWLLQKMGNICFLIKAYERKLKKYLFQAANSKLFVTSVVKYLKGDKHNSLHLARKYTPIFVLGHNLFLEAHSFHRALLSGNCSHLGTDNVRGQILALILALNIKAIVYLATGLIML